MTIIGKTITSITSRFGIVSKKGAERLAIETGKKFVDKSRELGRILTKDEFEMVMTETLPKRCRPQIITEDNEVIECMKRNNFTESQIKEQLDSISHLAAAVVGNGTKKLPIWIPFKRYEKMPSNIKNLVLEMLNSLVAHELEHALENNNRLFNIINRKISKIIIKISQLLKKDYLSNTSNTQIKIHKFEEEIQKGLIECLDKNSSKRIMNCDATLEGIAKQKGTNVEGYLDELRNYLRKNYMNLENKGSENFNRLISLQKFLEMEMPAYRVTGEVERYSQNLTDKENSIQTGIAKGYEASIKVAKQERITYWKNKLLGELKNPNIYATDEDLFYYAKTKEDKEILTSLIKDMKREQKECLIKILYNNKKSPNVIKNISKFIEKTTINGKSLYANKLESIENISTDILVNPDFIKIAKITDCSNSDSTVYSLTNIAKLNPKRMKEFAKIADKTIKIKIDKSFVKIHLYENLQDFLDNINFTLLKSLVEIKTKMGEYPYIDYNYLKNLSELSRPEIQSLLTKARYNARHGYNIPDELKELNSYNIDIKDSPFLVKLFEELGVEYHE